MYAEERQHAIASLIISQGRASVAELAEAYDVITETVRRDLAVLDRAGLVRRVHGGAVPVRALKLVESGVGERENTRAAHKDAIAAAAAAMTGEIQQVPTRISAIKVDGERAYALARAGQEVELAARPVTVSAFDVLDVHRVGSFLDLEVDVTCSSGTYIRALARDLGAGLGVGGHLTELRRTRVGPFGIEEAHTLEALAEKLAKVLGQKPAG